VKSKVSTQVADDFREIKDEIKKDILSIFKKDSDSIPNKLSQPAPSAKIDVFEVKWDENEEEDEELDDDDDDW